MNERKSVWKRKRSVGGKKRKKGKQEKKRVGAYMRVLMKSETSYEIRSRSKKIVKFEAAGCGTRTQIQDEVVLRSKPNFAKVAGALSCRIPFLPGEYRDRCFRVVEHPRCISFPLESSTFPPLFPLFIYSWSFDDPYEDLCRMISSCRRIQDTRTLVFSKER